MLAGVNGVEQRKKKHFDMNVLRCLSRSRATSHSGILGNSQQLIRQAVQVGPCKPTWLGLVKRCDTELRCTLKFLAPYCE